MLTLLARHGLIDLDVEADGDLHVDAHHTVEDVGIVLGQALRQAPGGQGRHPPLRRRDRPDGRGARAAARLDLSPDGPDWRLHYR